MAALLLVADDHGAAGRVQALLVALGSALPEAEHDELQDGADDDHDARVGELVDEEAQGHDHDEHKEEADGEADEDLAEALVLDCVESVDGEHHDRQQDGDGQHAGIEHGMRLERAWYDNDDGAENVGDGDDGDIADQVEYLARFWVDAGLHDLIPFSYLYIFNMHRLIIKLAPSTFPPLRHPLNFARAVARDDEREVGDAQVLGQRVHEDSFGFVEGQALHLDAADVRQLAVGAAKAALPESRKAVMVRAGRLYFIDKTPRFLYLRMERSNIRY